MVRLRRAEGQTALDRYLGPGERVVLETRQHPFVLIAAFLDAMLLVVPLMLVAWGVLGIGFLRNRVGDAIFDIAFLAALLVIGRFAWRVVQWEVARLFVTTEKVVHLHGVLNRKIASTPLVKVAELTVSQPFAGRIFGYGSLVVEGPGGSHQAMHGLSYIPNPLALYRTINEIARRERAYEGGADVNDGDTDGNGWSDTIVIRRPPRG